MDKGAKFLADSLATSGPDPRLTQVRSVMMTAPSMAGPVLCRNRKPLTDSKVDPALSNLKGAHRWPPCSKSVGFPADITSDVHCIDHVEANTMAAAQGHSRLLHVKEAAHGHMPKLSRAP